MEESRRRLPVAAFSCRERYVYKQRQQVQDENDNDDADDNDAGDNDEIITTSTKNNDLPFVVVFQCNLPPDPYHHHRHDYDTVLEFHCREPSCGALLPTETSAAAASTAAAVAADNNNNNESYDNDDNNHHKVEAEEDSHYYYYVDPNFFDRGYTLAGKTGFQVWTGTRFLLEALLWKLPPPDKSSSSSSSTSSSDHYKDCPRLQYWQERLFETETGSSGLHVLELGAGVGVVGTCLAAATGAQVLLTDLPTLVEHSIAPNLKRNHRAAFLKKMKHHSTDEQKDTSSCQATWLQGFENNAVSIYQGWAAATPLDWRIPVEEQLSAQHCEQVDLIIASDCVFLVEMLETLLTTAAGIFKRSSARKPSLLLSFQRRDAKGGDDSQSFTTVNRVLSTVRARQWSIECLAWRPVVVGNDTSEVFVFEVIPTDLYSASTSE